MKFWHFLSHHHHYYCFIHPIFRYWFLFTFGDEVTKIQKYYVIFVYILQGKIGKMEKTEKKSCNQSDKNIKIQKYVMNKTFVNTYNELQSVKYCAGC